MYYWQGNMNWPLAPDWKCEICGKNEGLTWGLVHAQCRCNNCHTPYRMRDEMEIVVNIPICQLKPEYYEAFKTIWEIYHIPIEEVNDEQWQESLAKQD